MTPLLIDGPVKAAIKQVVDYAEHNRITLDEIRRIIEQGTVVGDDPSRATIIPFGYRCCFSIEEQPFGWTRHLSVSIVVDDNGKIRRKEGCFPGKHAIRMIMDEFGMTKPFEHCHIHLEEAKINGSINIIEPIGDIDDLRRTASSCEEPQTPSDGSDEDRRHTSDRRGDERRQGNGNDHSPGCG